MAKKRVQKAKLKAQMTEVDVRWALQKIETAKAEVQNRNLSDAHVKFLAREITEGRWQENGQPIILDEDGYLIDGQHRLWAVIECQKPIRCLVVRGVHRETALPTIDLNRRTRSFADVITMQSPIGRKIDQPKTIQAAVKWLVRYREKKFFLSLGVVSAGRLQDRLVEEPGIVDSLWAGDSLRGLMPSTGLSVFAHYLFAQRNPEMADEFVEKLATGADLGVRSPILLLRQKIIDYKVKKERRSMEHMGYIVFRAWLHFEAGLPMGSLRWRKSASEKAPADPFPYLDIYPLDREKLRKAIKSRPKMKRRKAS